MQTFTYQIVVLNKINRLGLTLKRFEQKYLLLSGFRFAVMQISQYTIQHTCRVVNNTGKKYCNIQYQYQAKKVLPIPIPITP